MARKRKGLLGPDGRSIEEWKRANQPPARDLTIVSTREGFISFYGEMLSGAFEMSLTRDVATTGDEVRPKPEPTLAEAVGTQVDELVAGFDGESRAEMPEGSRDLTAYADAFDSAARKCPHYNTVEMLYNREYLCEDCRSIVSYAKLVHDRRRFGSSSPWGL